MIKIFLNILVVSFVVFFNSVSALEVEERIVGGASVKTKNHTWMTSLYRSPGNNDDKFFLCGGTLISPNIVLTAAHCVVRSDNTIVESETLRVVVNNLNIDGSDGEFSYVDNVIVHENYNDNTYINDIAIIVLSSNLKSEPIAIANTNIENYIETRKRKNLFSALGFGSTSGRNTALSKNLMKVNLNYISLSECNESWNNLSGNQVCAGDLNKDTCSGDSGGPLIVNTKNNRYLYGITSYGSVDCGDGVPAVYTKVSKYRSWIESKIQNSISLTSEVLGVDKLDSLTYNVKFKVVNNSVKNSADAVRFKIFNTKYIEINNNFCVLDKDVYDCQFFENLEKDESKVFSLNIKSRYNIDSKIILLYKVAGKSLNNYNNNISPLELRFNKYSEIALISQESVVNEKLNGIVYANVGIFFEKEASNLNLIIEDNVDVKALNIEQYECVENQDIQCNLANDMEKRNYSLNLLSSKDKFISNIIINNGQKEELESVYINLIEEPKVKEGNGSSSSSGGGSVGIFYLLMMCAMVKFKFTQGKQ